MSIDPSKILVVMDAQCSICAKGARWIAANDARDEFRIVPLQTQLGRDLMLQNDSDPDDPASWLVLDNGRALKGMNAWFFVSKRLNQYQKLATALRLIPRPVRDLGYRIVAKNRRRIFAADDLCHMPDPAVARRLIQ